MTHDLHAQVARAGTPTNDKADAANVGQVGEQRSSKNSDSQGARHAGQALRVHDPLQAFRAAILAAVGHAPDSIEPGRFQRFATTDRRCDTAGWCKLFDDLRGGVFGCYRQGISETWHAQDRATMPHAARAELARQGMAATVLTPTEN